MCAWEKDGVRGRRRLRLTRHKIRKRIKWRDISDDWKTLKILSRDNTGSSATAHSFTWFFIPSRSIFLTVSSLFTVSFSSSHSLSLPVPFTPCLFQGSLLPCLLQSSSLSVPSPSPRPHPSLCFLVSSSAFFPPHYLLSSFSFS